MGGEEYVEKQSRRKKNAAVPFPVRIDIQSHEGGRSRDEHSSRSGDGNGNAFAMEGGPGPPTTWAAATIVRTVYRQPALPRA